MDVTQVLKNAWKAVEEAGVPQQIQASAFDHAVRLLTEGGAQEPGASEASRQGTGRGTGQRNDSSSSKSNEVSNPQGDVTEASYFKKFSDESGVSVEKLHGVYIFENGTVRLGVTRRKLGDSEAEKNRSVATLLAGARYFAEGNVSTSIASIRDAAKALGHDPSRNLGAHLDSVLGTQAVGVKSDKSVRVQGNRFDDPFRELIDRLVDD